MQALVAVVIPARNDAESLRDAVESVVRQQNVTVGEVVIAVGPSTDTTAAVAAALASEFDVVSMIENPSGDTPSALNAAIAATSGEVVVRVDARSVLPEHYIEHALETMRDTDAANVGAIQRPVGATTRQRAIAAAMASPFGSGAAAYRGAEERQRVDTAYLGVFQRAALAAVGGYDETFIRNQDAELNLRLNKAGHHVWLDPRMVVDYFPRSTLRRLGSQYWQYGWWRQRTIHTHGSFRLRQLVAPLIVLTLVAALVVGALLNPWALLIPALYAMAMMVVALMGSGRIAERFITAAALMTMHVSWGAGFLCSAVASRLGVR